MKFGKTIQSQQVPGWGEYYLNYKALKKIINSYAAGRPASDASLLSLGLRPAKRTLSTSSTPSIASPPTLQPGTASPLSQIPTTTLSARPPSGPSHVVSIGFNASSDNDGESRIPQMDLDPLPPEMEPPGAGAGMRRSDGPSSDKSDSFKAHRDVFFFTLQRELEKINAFYLIKERDLRLRLLTLLTNRRRLVQSLSSGQQSIISGGYDDVSLDTNLSKGLEWGSLEEGWRLFERDLGKLQGFIEINATGFRKILKKWDKRSKSNTKEMYLERQVEVQPCFNREFIAKLSDVVAANLLDLQNGSADLPKSIFADLPESIGADGLSLDRNVDYDRDAGETFARDAVADLEANLVKALATGGEAVDDWLRVFQGKNGDQLTVSHMRLIWRAVLNVPEAQVDTVLATVPVDFHHIDKINGRSPLHQACISGSLKVVKLCVEKIPELLEKPDAYDRRPLHYASLHGHSSIVSFLLDHSADATVTDMDGYTPLMHAITQGHVEVVQLFVESKINLEPTAVSNDLIPLSLACQSGHFSVAKLLLECGAKIIPNSEGLYPQHFAAKAGHEAICQLLVEAGGPTGGGKDQPDKYNLWTPLHHAAVGGNAHHLACMKVLVAAGCDVNASDEYGKSPGWYAAWFGHVECLNYLIASGAKVEGKQQTLSSMENLGLAADPQMDSLSPGSDLDLDQAGGQDEFELIPSLSLPPPIIPLRVYGHEFLAQRSLVQLSLGHPFSRNTDPKPLPVKLYSRSGEASLHMWSSLKLVMTSKSDITAVPHSVILPLADEREVFSFQVANLDKFTLELSLYPTFGSKVIGRTVVLPSTFKDIRHHKGFIAPLLDHQLKTIGEVAFEVSCIKPFEEAQLEIGGRVETYWKSKVTPSAPTQDHAHQLSSHRPLSVSTSSPALRPPLATLNASTQQGAQKESALVTASSLSGEYIHISVQLTKDGIPVVYPSWKLPVSGLDVGVSDVTYAQFEALARSQNRELSLESGQNASTAAEWYALLFNSMSSLENVLRIVPLDVGLNVQLKYLREFDSKLVNVSRSKEVNEFVDPILHDIYQAGKNNPGTGRKIIFSSFDPTICTALNWKQPNFAVFFSSYCGVSRYKQGSELVPASKDEESDMRCLSVREAVNFAKSTNLLGVLLEATTLAAVPSLLASVKDAGLLLAAFGDKSHISALRAGASDGRTVDAFVNDGIMTLTI